MTPAIFRHEALMYAGEHQLVDGVLQFLRDGVEAEEPTLVVLADRKISALREALGRDAAHIQFADMDDVGANPARIIPAWREFVDANPGKRLRGIGEPIWAARSDAEMSECHRHEGLLNVAFADTPGFWLLCPYDTMTLDPAVVARACETHPHVAGLPSAAYPGFDVHAGPFTDPLPAPAREPDRVEFDGHSLSEMRRFVAARVQRAELSGDRAHDFLLAVNEIATNAVVHGRSPATLRIWHSDGEVIVEVSDAGDGIGDVLAGQLMPTPSRPGGRGLWLSRLLCDAVEVRNGSGCTVALHANAPSAG